jgi:hypothetical protein
MRKRHVGHPKAERRIPPLRDPARPRLSDDRSDKSQKVRSFVASAHARSAWRTSASQDDSDFCASSRFSDRGAFRRGQIGGEKKNPKTHPRHRFRGEGGSPKKERKRDSSAARPGAPLAARQKSRVASVGMTGFGACGARRRKRNPKSPHAKAACGAPAACSRD